VDVLTLTESAAAKVRELLARDGREGHALRLKVSGGRCSEGQYRLMFDENVGELDHESQQYGVRVFIDPQSAGYLTGTSIDYTDDLDQAGFQIQNPTATSTCGCGESFSA
jgi:iron-sulfur cluster assembly accessory protein